LTLVSPAGALLGSSGQTGGDLKITLASQNDFERGYNTGKINLT